MIVKEAKFIGSYEKLSQCPKTEIPEYAFIGRSNVGKSSLINMLCNHQGLARVSKQPGKTQHINYFKINKEWFLVDLPGYGYAKRSQKLRRTWEIMINTFLINRLQVQCVFLLIDINIPPQKIDLEFANWLGKNNIPFIIVFTKADRRNDKKNNESIFRFQKEMKKTWHHLPPHYVTSSNSTRGKEEILNCIDDINKQFAESSQL